VDQISPTSPTEAPIEAHDDRGPAGGGLAAEPSGFGTRGRARRRARFLRKARELAYRDLGGLVFNLHRFGQRNDTLVMAKLTTLAHIDAELRTLEATLGDGRPVTVLREAGITACARCAAIHSSEDHFCPNCGLSLGRHADLPIAGGAAATVADATSPVPAAAAPAAAQAAGPAAARAPASQPAPGEPEPSGASAGRSPTPPPKTAAPVAASPRELAPGSPGEAQSTEILRPPTASQ
jgi:hypothetical protein